MAQLDKKEFQRRLQKIEGLVQSIESAADPNVRASAIELLQTLMEIHGAAIERMMEMVFENAAQKSREEALRYALASAHTILGLGDGEFVSLLDTPEAFREAAAACKNSGTFPVLAGQAGTPDMMLSSPIILYDYPQIAPESDGNLFDSTEIDEILLLRIMTLTEEEKREMRFVDERARQILERVESLPSEQLMKLHGARRGLRSA